ncbi:Sterol O-acyltransferase 2 [Dissostichus eleginoides]|uniref:Sterol O-acyltransferase 2 n=1 Tax=Dissostichus eleginoides TaxID=100907 RepID=A0AAD9CI84_DISEL|nr:Sterol O-acyltransferase 2 [Dissostichus eleginoides]
MTTPETPNGVVHRNIKTPQSEEISGPAGNLNNVSDEDLRQWQKHAQRVKEKVLEQVKVQLSDLLDQALTETVESFTQTQPKFNGKTTNKSAPRSQRTDDGKVFVARPSLLDELFEINHIRTIYHMFIAVLLMFCLSTLAVDYIDQVLSLPLCQFGSSTIEQSIPRSISVLLWAAQIVLEFDLLFFAFGKLGTVIWAWAVMFFYTLLVPYLTLVIWGSLYHTCPSKLGLSLGTGLILSAVQTYVLGLFPIFVVVQYQLPPASRFIVILEQIRFLMKSYSFIRETGPVIMRNTPKEGESPRFPSLSSYLYFLFCPTLIYRESYPRNTI